MLQLQPEDFAMKKPWYKKPSFWIGLSGVASGIFLLITGSPTLGIPAIISGIGVIFTGHKYLNI